MRAPAHCSAAFPDAAAQSLALSEGAQSLAQSLVSALRCECQAAPIAEALRHPSAIPAPRADAQAQSVDFRGVPPRRWLLVALPAPSLSSCQIATCSTSVTSLLIKRGQRTGQPLSYHNFIAGLLRSSCRCGNCRRAHVHFDLLRLRFLALRNGQRQHTVLVIGF